MKLCILVIAFALVFASCGGGSSVENADQNAQPAMYADANVALADGIQLLDTGETERAIDVLNQAVTLNPDLAEAYFRLGIAYALIETRDASIVDETAETAPGEKKPKEKKMNSEIAFGKAVEAYKKIIATNKDDYAAYFNLGRAYNKLNEDEDAERAFEKAVDLNPEDTEYQTELGKIRIKLAKYREAIPSLKKAIELDPDNVEAIEFLEDAEAGRSRVNYSSTPKKDANSNSNANSSNTNSAPANSNTSTKPPPANNPPVNPAVNKP